VFNPGQWSDAVSLSVKAKVKKQISNVFHFFFFDIFPQVENYNRAVMWLHRSLFDCVVTTDRLLLALASLLSRVGTTRRMLLFLKQLT
jgi:hypothetical protein